MQYYSNVKNYVLMTRGEAFNGKSRRQTYSQYNGKILLENVNSSFFLDNEYMGLLTEVALDKYLFSKSSSVFSIQQAQISHFTPFLE